jgi:alkaline phosphatase D
VTSDGFYELVRASLPAGTPAEAVVGATRGITGTLTTVNPWIKYLDGLGHGYTLVDVTPDRVQADYFHTPTPTSALPDPRVVASTLPALTTSWQTLAGTRRVTPAPAPIGARTDNPG